MKAKIVGMLAAAMLAVPVAAQATVLYELTWNGITLSYSSPTFVSADLVNCVISDPCTGLNFYPNMVQSDYVGWRLSQHDESFHYFPNGAFSTFGTYSELVRGVSVLTVSRVPQSVPEPGSLVILGISLTGLVLSRRRKPN